MTALLSELERTLAPLRRRWIAGVAVGVVLGGPILGLAFAGSTEERCKLGQEYVDPIWNPQRQGAIERAFVATDLPFAASTWERVRDRLDDYAQRWSEQHRTSCEATFVRREQSEDTHRQQAACLHRRLAAFRAVIERFATADEATVTKAIEVAGKLPEIADCADPAYLLATVAPAPDAATAAAADRIRDRLAAVEALWGTDSVDRALDEARASATDAAELGYGPVQAEAAVVLGGILRAKGQHAEARDQLVEAFTRSLGLGHDTVAVTAALDLVALAVARASPRDEGELWAAQAEASRPSRSWRPWRVTARRLWSCNSARSTRSIEPTEATTRNVPESG
jgi:hypothetical protein